MSKLSLSTRTPRLYSEPPSTPSPSRPEAVSGLLKEWRALWQLGRCLRNIRKLRAMPQGDKSTILLIPGWRAPESSMLPLTLYLRSIGYDAKGWGFGVNHGDPQGDSERLSKNVKAMVEESGKPVILIGWSLGGVVARETARLAPNEVKEVYTYGTPVIGGPTYTIGAKSWGEEQCKYIADTVAGWDRENPIQVPITAIFSKNDSIVSWPACIDTTSRKVLHAEVTSTHVGMGFDPDVWMLIAERLKRMSGSEERKLLSP